MKKILVLLISCFSLSSVLAQSNFGKLQGKVNDAKTKKAIAYATIILEKDGIRKGGAYTDEDGKYVINALDPGNYSVTVKYLDYKDKKITDVDVFANGTKYLNIEMSQLSAEDGGGEELGPVVIRAGKPMIEKDNNSKTIGSKDIAKLPTRNLNAIAGITSGANQTSGGGISFLGSRTDATAYFVDGVRVLGSSSVPQSAQGQIEIIQSGVPAQYGDFTGGAIVITTKGPSRFVNRSFEMITSTLLDPYSFNQAEFSAVGPLWIKNKGGGKKEYVALGYQMAANFNYTLDPSPGYGGFYSVKDDVLAQIEANPIIENPNGPLNVYRSLLLTKDDLEINDARKNVASYGGNFQGKLEFQPNKNSTLTLFGSFNQGQGNNFSYDQSLMNYNRYSNTTNQTLRTYVKFTQRLGSTSEEDKEKKKSLFSDAFYNIRVDYQSRWQENQNLDHGQNFFDYGYIGKFTEYRKPFYQFKSTPTLHIDQNGDTVVRQNYFDLAGTFNTKITFDPSDKNPIRANYTSQLFREVEASGFNFNSTNQIQQGLGLLNGFAPGYSYSLWANPGLGNNGYSKSQFERIAAYAQGEAILNLENTHDLQFGIYYEQTLFSSWSLAAGNLWTLMPLLANSHISNLDQVTENGYIIGGNHSYDDNGLFTDTVDYNIRIDKDQQKTFDKNLRAKLIADGAVDVYGNPYTESSYIDINSLSPSTFNLNMFSAGDLWNNGNSFVGYFGYDYLGNRTRKAFSFTDFTNDDATKGIGSFSPISNAIWLQDKFQFKDLVLRLGVRVERYDGNQLGLKDQYSLFPTYSAGEIQNIESGERGSNLLANYQIPGNIGEDYVVYVNDIESPGTKSGRIQPFLQSTDEELVPEAFQDYTPTINVLPRVMFSFPINSEALFFASYDKLAQRPQDGAIFAPINRYDYLEENQGGTLPNANLQPRVTTSYELGFKQTLTQNSALSLIAAYRSTQGDFALVQITQAYPITYNSYQNLDFETIKNFRAEYELRGEGRTSLGVNYSLLFADGTGSNINSAAALIQAGQPNLRSLYPTSRDIRHQISAVLDYRFKSGNDYTGPIWFDKRVFENFGGNFIFSTKSGEPYSAYINPIASAASGSAQRQSLDGNPFGSRLPWQFKVDANFSKSFNVKKKNPKDSYRRQATEIQAFLWVQNLFNTKNIQRVYGFSGLPTSDGWLSSPQGIQEASNAVNTQSYVALYNAKVESPYFYETPRTIRLGLRMYF